MNLPHHKVPHDDWFNNPLDSMPIATDKAWLDTSPSEMQPPGVDEEVEPTITIHEKMYRLATKNGSTIGGSESVGY